MRVCLSDVSRALEDLLEKRRSREEIAEWASALRRAEDAGTLDYVPPTDEERIWQGIQYLMGVDLRDGPRSYLHTQEDFERFADQWQALGRS